MNLFVMMECKKIKTTVLGHFAKCCTRQRTPLPSAMITALGKAGKMSAQKTDFLALPSAVTMTLCKEILKKKKIQTLPSAGHRALGKRFSFFFKFLCRVSTQKALDKDFLFFFKNFFAECYSHSTRQSWKICFLGAHFSSFAECCDHFAECNTRQSDPKRQILIFFTFHHDK